MTRAEYDANPVAGAAKIRDGYTVVNGPLNRLAEVNGANPLPR